MKHIVIGGNEYPCRITMGAMVRYKRMTGNDVSKLAQDDVCGIVEFAYCCVVSACRADGVEFGLEFETFADMLEPTNIKDFFDTAVNVEKKTKATV